VLGPFDIKTTQRYLNITDEEVRKSLTGVWILKRLIFFGELVRLAGLAPARGERERDAA
jgi:hypothetical protein